MTLKNINDVPGLDEVLSNDDYYQKFLTWETEESKKVTTLLFLHNLYLIKNNGSEKSYLSLRELIDSPNKFQEFKKDLKRVSYLMDAFLCDLESVIDERSRNESFWKNHNSNFNLVYSEAYFVVERDYDNYVDHLYFSTLDTKRKRRKYKIGPRKMAMIKNLIGFFLCGLVNNFGYVVMLCAADHLTSSPPKILAADIVPSFLVKIISPFILYKLSYNLRITVAVLLNIMGFVLVAFSVSEFMTYLGVICASLSSGLGEVTFLALTSYYRRDVVSSWSSGTGAAGVFGSMWYLVFTVAFKFIPVSSRQFVAILTCSWIPLIMIFSYFFLLSKIRFSNPEVNRGYEKGESEVEITSQVDEEPDNRKHLLGKSENDNLTDSKNENNDAVNGEYENILLGKKSTSGCRKLRLKSLLLSEDYKHSYITSNTSLSLKERIKMIPLLLWYMIPLVLVYFGEYLINHSIAPSLIFNGTMIACNEYVIYQGLYQIGVFISRSSVNFFPISNIWILPFLQILNLNLFIYDVGIFHFISSYWIVFLIVLFEGLLGGAAYVNVFYSMSIGTTGKAREYSMAAVGMSDSIGISLSSAVGIYLNYLLKNINHIKFAERNCPK